MVDGFMDSFANRFKNINYNNISVARDKQLFSSANIYICDGEIQLCKNNSRLSFSKKTAPSNSYNPNINILFNSFSILDKDIDLLCVILTGIGEDGVDACKNLSISGARCVTENETSAIVDGMPSRARLLVPKIESYDIDTIVKSIEEFCE